MKRKNPMSAEPSLVVSLTEKSGVTRLCSECGIKPAKRQFCSGACRQTAYRKGAAHAECLKRDRNWRAARRVAHFTAINRDRSIGAFLVYSGPVNTNVPRLGEFWISPSGKRMNVPRKEEGAR
jgi:hypothetical protein